MYMSIYELYNNNYYSNTVNVAYSVIFEIENINVNNKRSPPPPLVFAFCKDINASLLFIFSITTRSHRIVSRTLLVVKTPSSTHTCTQKSGSSKNALYLHLHNGSR